MESEKVKKYSLPGNLVFILKNTWACDPKLLFWCFLIIFCSAVGPVLSTFLPKVVIEGITSGDSLKSVVSAALAFTLAEAVLAGIKMFSEKHMSWNKYKMNTHYLQKIAAKGMETDYRNQESEWFRKLQSESRESCYGNFSVMTAVYDHWNAFCAGTLGFLVYFGILARLNALVVAFLIVTTVVGFYLNDGVIRWTEKHREEKIGYQQRTGYITDVSADIKAAKDIRLYGMAEWFGDIYRKNMEAMGRWQRRYAKKVFGVSACESGLSMLRDVIAYAYLLYLTAGGKITAADFVLYFGVITGFSAWLSGILGEITELKRAGSAADYLRAYLDWPEEYRREGGLDTAALLKEPAVIELKNVHFRYEGAQEETLRGIDLKVAPGEHLAVVGLNGAGKTTLVKLLCGLTDPNEGTVRYAGNDVKDYDRRAYYQLFAAVFQQFSVLPVSFAQIVAEGGRTGMRESAECGDADRAKVEKCLKQAGLWEKIASLPKGMDSLYGKTLYDDGTDLSGGEMQKLLLARALYRDAPVVVLDEPTAALDPLAESALYESYDELMRDKSVVFISHRLASTRFCHRIILLEDGKVAEEGSHEELLKLGGRYAQLYEIQAKYYKESAKTAGEEETGDEV